MELLSYKVLGTVPNKILFCSFSPQEVRHPPLQGQWR